MEIIDGIVIISVTWSLVAGGYLYLQKWSMMSREIETLREEGRQFRQANAPRDWWQEIAVEIAKNPDTLDKILSLVTNPEMAKFFSQYKMK